MENLRDQLVLFIVTFQHFCIWFRSFIREINGVEWLWWRIPPPGGSIRADHIMVDFRKRFAEEEYFRILWKWKRLLTSYTNALCRSEQSIEIRNSILLLCIEMEIIWPSSGDGLLLSWPPETCGDAGCSEVFSVSDICQKQTGCC